MGRTGRPSQKGVTPEAGARREGVPEFPPPFSDVTAEILERAEMRRFSSGEKVIEEGDTGESVYIIRNGNAAVFGHFLGKKVRLSTLSAGDFFGEVAFLTGRTRTAR